MCTYWMYKYDKCYCKHGTDPGALTRCEKAKRTGQVCKNAAYNGKRESGTCPICKGEAPAVAGAKDDRKK